MDSRAARRLATTRLAQTARTLAGELADVDEFSPADRVRVRRAFDALAYELDVRTGAIPRGSRPVPVDPAQETLFDLRQKDAGDGQEAQQETQDR
jgi:hypothetical protein